MAAAGPQPWLWQLGGTAASDWAASAWAAADAALGELSPKESPEHTLRQQAPLTALPGSPPERRRREHFLETRRSLRTSLAAFVALPRGRCRQFRGDLFTEPGPQQLLQQGGPLLDEADEGQASRQELPRSPESLCAAAAIFAGLTLLQVCGATLAHSSVLLVDCISLGVDAASYLGSMAVESQTDSQLRAHVELLVGGASIAALMSFSICALHDGWLRIGQEAGGAVRPWVLLAFGSAGAFCDLSWLLEVRGKAQLKLAGGIRKPSAWPTCIHLAADATRSLAILGVAILVLLLGLDGTAADVWASLLVGTMILFRAVLGLAEWLRQLECLVFGRAVLFSTWGHEGRILVSGSETDEDSRLLGI